MRVRGKPDLCRRDLLKVAGVGAAVGVVPFTAGVAMAADRQKMKIGIIGSGHVGSALGGVWTKAGNEVMFSSRHLESDRKLAAEVGAKCTGRYAAGSGCVRSSAAVSGSVQRLPRAHQQPR